MESAFPVEQSIVAPHALLSIAAEFEIETPLRCDFLRRGLNDTYLVWIPTGRFILRVYRARRWTLPQIEYEIELLRHLERQGVRAPRPIPLRSGGFLLEIAAPEGARAVALFTFLPGEPPSREDAAFVERYASAIGEIHAATDNFVTTCPRQSLDLDYLLDEPLAALRQYLFDRPRDLAYIESLAETLRARIAPLLPSLDRGPVHGDASLTNIHVMEDGSVAFFDFDNAGPGPRANDTAAFWGNAQERGKEWIWEAFLRGYEGAHRLSEADIDVLPAFHAARLFMSLGFHAANPIYWGVVRQKEIVDREIAMLRQGEEGL